MLLNKKNNYGKIELFVVRHIIMCYTFWDVLEKSDGFNQYPSSYTLMNRIESSWVIIKPLPILNMQIK